jgi:hypothetical protein
MPERPRVGEPCPSAPVSEPMPEPSGDPCPSTRWYHAWAPSDPCPSTRFPFDFPQVWVLTKVQYSRAARAGSWFFCILCRDFGLYKSDCTGNTKHYGIKPNVHWTQRHVAARHSIIVKFEPTNSMGMLWMHLKTLDERKLEWNWNETRMKLFSLDELVSLGWKSQSVANGWWGSVVILWWGCAARTWTTWIRS